MEILQLPALRSSCRSLPCRAQLKCQLTGFGVSSLTLRPTVSRPVCLRKSTHLGLKPRSLLLSDSCRFVDVGRSLWREDDSVVHNCCWPSPAQSLSGPRPLGPATIFYCLMYETGEATEKRTNISIVTARLYKRPCIGKKISGRGPQGALHQDELIGGKPPVVK
jgi:hypothetical protein